MIGRTIPQYIRKIWKSYSIFQNLILLLSAIYIELFCCFNTALCLLFMNSLMQDGNWWRFISISYIVSFWNSLLMKKKKKKLRTLPCNGLNVNLKKKNAKSTQVSDCMKVYFNVVTFTTYLIQMHYFLIVLWKNYQLGVKI